MTTAITEYSPIEAGLAALRHQYDSVVYDVQTSTGMEEARKARHEIRKTRYALEAARKKAKKESIAYSRLVDSEAKKIETELYTLENPIDDQIVAEETRKENERKIKEEEEKKRKAAIVRRLDAIKYSAYCPLSDTAEAIQGKIAFIEELKPTEEDFGEWLIDAFQEIETALSTLKNFLSERIERDQEKARQKKEREELDRQKAEQAARQKELDDAAKAQAAEAKRIADAQKVLDDASEAERKRTYSMPIMDTLPITEGYKPENGTQPTPPSGGSSAASPAFPSSTMSLDHKEIERPTYLDLTVAIAERFKVTPSMACNWLIGYDAQTVLKEIERRTKRKTS